MKMRFIFDMIKKVFIYLFIELFEIVVMSSELLKIRSVEKRQRFAYVGFGCWICITTCSGRHKVSGTKTDTEIHWYKASDSLHVLRGQVGKIRHIWPHTGLDTYNHENQFLIIERI